MSAFKLCKRLSWSGKGQILRMTTILVQKSLVVEGNGMGSSLRFVVVGSGHPPSIIWWDEITKSRIDGFAGNECRSTTLVDYYLP